MDFSNIPRRKVFLSYQHEEDRIFRDWFAYLIDCEVVGESVEDSDIRDYNINTRDLCRSDQNSETKALRQKIRDDLIADAEVTVVLLGPCAWQSRRVDWEIGASLTDTPNRARCGLMAIILPNHPDFKGNDVHVFRIPPRLADNVQGTYNKTYATIYQWPYNQKSVDEIRQMMRDPKKAEQERQRMSISKCQEVEWAHQLDVTNKMCLWIDDAFQRRKRLKPKNDLKQFSYNKSGHCFEGWHEYMLI